MFFKLTGRQRRKVIRFVLIFINILLMFSVIYLYSFAKHIPSNKKRQIKKNSSEKDHDFDCHYIKEKDALPAIDKTITFPTESIFFIEATCRGLTSRQACSVESAARANPQRQVNVLFTSPITWDMFKGSAISTLLAIANVEAARIHLETYAEDTPLYTKFKLPLAREDLNMDLVDILKYLTIYKYSGTYLALDIIVARSFQSLNDSWVVKQSPASMSSDMFSFSSSMNGKSIADIALNLVVSDLAKSENHNLWSFDSTTIMKKLMRIWCLTGEVMFLNSNTCPDLQVLEPENFYPISFHDRQTYFRPVDWAKWKDQKIYTYQLWDRFTKYNVFDDKSLYAHIAREYCPMVYKFYGSKFGLM